MSNPHGTRIVGPSSITRTQGGWMTTATIKGRRITIEGCQGEAEAEEWLRAQLEGAARSLGVSVPARSAERTLEELGHRLEAP